MISNLGFWGELLLTLQSVFTVCSNISKSSLLFSNRTTLLVSIPNPRLVNTANKKDAIPTQNI